MPDTLQKWGDTNWDGKNMRQSRNIQKAKIAPIKHIDIYFTIFFMKS